MNYHSNHMKKLIKLSSFIALLFISSQSLAAEGIIAENLWLSIFIAAISGAAVQFNGPPWRHLDVQR